MDEADLAPVLDVAFGCGIGDAEAGGVFQEGLGAEGERKAPEELLLAVVTVNNINRKNGAPVETMEVETIVEQIDLEDLP